LGQKSSLPLLLIPVKKTKTTFKNNLIFQQTIDKTCSVKFEVNCLESCRASRAVEQLQWKRSVERENQKTIILAIIFNFNNSYDIFE
jgi:hypothetical protein